MAKSFSLKLRLFTLLLGITLIVFYLQWTVHQSGILSFKKAPVIGIKSEIKHPTPQRLLIQSLKIDLPVSESKIVKDIWEVNDNGASHLNISANPGDKGNIIIYGHNKQDLLGNIRVLKAGDKISIKNKEGKDYNYSVYKTLTVNRDQVDVLNTTKDEVLILYTCTGFLDSQRFIVKAKLI